MSLADAAQRVPATRKGPRCGIAVVLDRLPDSDQQLLTGWLTANLDDVPHAWISRVLAEEGHRVGGDAIRRHRARQCSCSG